MHILTYKIIRLSTMPIVDITNKILADASEEAGSIIKNTETKVSELSDATKILKENTKKESVQKTNRILEENERRIVSAAEQEVKLKADNAKRTAVDIVFENTLKQLLSLPSKEYEEVILSLLNELPENTNGEIIAPKERKIETESALKKAKLKYEVEATNKFKGGFILLGENFESNFVFEEILRNKKSALEVEVARILFN